MTPTNPYWGGSFRPGTKPMTFVAGAHGAWKSESIANITGERPSAPDFYAAVEESRRGEMPDTTSSFFSRRKFMLTASWLGSALLFTPSDAIAATGQQLKASEIGKPRILVFDVIETMLDLNALRPHFEQVFGSSSALDEWFSLLLQYSMVVTQADAYYSFGEIAGAAL